METKLKSQAINIDSIYPVGSIYITTVSTNPSNYFGGTWVAFGAGKTLVGLDSGDTDFDTSEETGGAKTTNISHSHGLSAGAAQIGSDHGKANTLAFTASQNGSLTGTTYTVQGTTITKESTRSHNTALTGSTDSGGSTTSSIVQPYIVTYFFKRTA